MKKFLSILAIAATMFIAACSTEYDDTEVWNSINSIEQRLSAVETVVNAYKNNLFIESVTQTDNGYVIKFSDGSTATIANGKDGVNGTDGKDGINGTNGKDGVDGANGKDGADGKDGVNGADGKDGKDGVDGKDGKDGETLIESITIGTDEVTFVLTDGSKFSIPLYSSLTITFDSSDLVIAAPKSTVEIAYSVKSSTDSAVVEVTSSADLKAKVVAGTDGLSGNICVTTGEVVDEYSKVLVFVSNGEKVIMKSLAFASAGIVVEEEVVKSVPATGGNVTLEFLTNVEYQVVIPEAAQSWIAVAPETRALEKKSVSLVVSANTGAARQAVVTVQGKENNSLKVEYTISQDSAYSTIEEIIAAGEGTYTVKDAWVVASYGRGFLATDASGKYILCYQGTDATVPAVGTIFSISGDVTAYAGLLQFGPSATITAAEQTKSVELGEPAVLSAAELDAYLSAPEVKYAQFEGTLNINNNYYNVTIEGTETAIGSLSYPAGDIAAALAELNGKAIKVTGFMIGASSGKYTNMMVTAVEAVDGGEAPEPTPEIVAINTVTEAGTYAVTGNVVAVGTQAYIVADATGAMMVYNSNHGRTVGENVTISGDVTIYTNQTGTSFGTPQFSSSATVTVNSTDNVVTFAPTVLDAAALDAMLTEKLSKEIEFVGTLVVSGNYINIEVDGAATQGSIKYVDNTAYTSLDGKTVTVKGYFVGASSNKYINVLPYSIAEAEEPTPDPEPATSLPAIDVTAHYTFKLAQSVEGGKWYALVANNMAAQGLSSNYGYLKVTEVTPENNIISLPATHAFGLLAVEGGYTIQQYDGKYVYQSGTYNSFNVSATLPTEGVVWDIDYTASVATITNVEKAKFIQFDTQYTSYGCYDTEKGIKPALYELVEVDTTPKIISVSADKLSFVAAGEVKDITIETYGDATLTATSDASWATATVSGNTISITATANDVEQAREGKLTITYGEASATVELLQAAKPAAGEAEPTTATIDFSAQGYTNAQSVDGVEIKVDDNVTVVFAKGNASTAPSYYTASNGIRMYQNGSTLDVTANGKTITSIEFTFDNNMWYIGADSGSLSEEGAVRTWTGEAASVKFTSTGTDKSHRAYVKSLKVTYK